MLDGARTQREPMRRFKLTFFTLAAALGSGSCSTLYGPPAQVGVEALGTHGLKVAETPAACQESLGSESRGDSVELDASHISLLSWNVKKGVLDQWHEDFMELASGKDLVLIQEAALDEAFTQSLADMDHWAFGPGYRASMQLTGVMTYSRAAPLAHCNLTTLEPWFKTPKATTVTEYGLSGTDNSLVVVNIHAINFSFGVEAFSDQMDQVRQVLKHHHGPVILSGDFNTWQPVRVKVVENLINELGLEPLAFEEDHRTLFFGQRLDHIFVRGLIPTATGTRNVRTSDHNPLSAELQM